MKNIIIILLGVLTLFGFSSPYYAKNIEQDLEAKKLLDKVSESMQKTHRFTVYFTFTVEDAAQKPMGKKEGIFYAKNAEYKITLTPNQEIFSDGKIVYHYDKNTQEIQIKNIDTQQSTLSPEKLFTNFYDKDFSYKFIGKKTIGKTDFDAIELTPKDGQKPFSKIMLYLDMKRKIPMSATIFDKSGLQYNYLITKFDKVSPVGNISFNKN
ncbi:MAG: LolA family protein, partial [Chitinophagaceae bacterium]